MYYNAAASPKPTSSTVGNVLFIGVSEDGALVKCYNRRSQEIIMEDVMLLYAECLGATNEGYRMLNKIRERAGLDALEGLSEGEFQQAVADERRYELAEEGYRWHDLVRQYKFVETMRDMFRNDDTTANGTYAAFADRVTEDMYLYPIPQSQIEVRKGLYSQNPGY